ncbi:MAG TPA: N-acetylmuramoyl-L-alanine amidase [Blastocatellia bacterium]
MNRKVKTEIIGIQSQAANGRHDNHLDNHMDNDNRSGVQPGNDPAAANGKGAAATPNYSSVVERYATVFERPEDRLRFVNNTLTKQADRTDRFQRRYGRFQFFERTRLYHRVLEARCYSAIFEEMRAMSSSLPRDRRHLTHRIHAPFSARLAFLVHQTRHAFYSASAVFAVLMLLVFASFGMWSARGVNAYLENVYGRGNASATAPTPNPNNDIIKIKEKIFFIATENGFEKWSNGCIISTKYETDNHPRSYYTIPRGGESDGEQKSNKIAGILYHTPESAMFDFDPENKNAIQQGSRGLLALVQRHKKYNYMINRIGEIYRIVRDDQAAIHAGHSLWADDQNTYVLLNESFLGVCFESKFDGASSLEEILTPAQIRSGKLLTDVLRTKYNIDDANCTTHGLVAVDQKKMLIARHHDWVRFFPFKEMGLSDKYRIHPPNMVDYGFTYDNDVMAKIGNQLWEGAMTAGEEFKKRAELAGVSPDDLRQKMKDLYISQCNKVARLHPYSGDADRLAEKPSGADPTSDSTASESLSDAWKAIN